MMIPGALWAVVVGLTLARSTPVAEDVITVVVLVGWFALTFRQRQRCHRYDSGVPTKPE